MSSRLLASVGVFLVAGSVYAAANAGRIDIIDGQYRFEVAKNILEAGSIQVMDPFLGDAVVGIRGVYSYYGLSGSIVALPLVLVARLGVAPSIDGQQFLFSFTSAVFGAGTAAVLFLSYQLLGVGWRAALAWTAVAAFATLAFPASTTVFDQVQHGFFVLCAGILAYLSGRRDSMGLAVAGGLALVVLVNFQETYALMMPTLAVAALAPAGAAAGDRRRGIERAIVFMFVGGMGLLLWAGINSFRFGTLLATGKGLNHPPVFGNPLTGLTGLLVSPGKSIFLYSPPAALAIVGLYKFARLQPRLGVAAASAIAAHVGLISLLTFYGGDWCWGPRYLAPVLPLLALGFPFLRPSSTWWRAVTVLIVVLGVGVQMLALSIDHHRFFYQRSLSRFFWYTQPSLYFRTSALFDRPGELFETITRGVPEEADLFRPGPYPGMLTYAVFGGWGHPQMRPPQWMRQYRVFWLPRPWLLWMRTLPDEQRPLDMGGAALTLTTAALTGVGVVALASRRRRHLPLTS